MDVEVRGARLDEFLSDDTVKEAFRLMKERAYSDFLAADSNDARIMAQATAKVVDTLHTMLRAVIGEGERARIERERRERAPDTRHSAE